MFVHVMIMAAAAQELSGNSTVPVPETSSSSLIPQSSSAPVTAPLQSEIGERSPPPSSTSPGTQMVVSSSGSGNSKANANAASSQGGGGGSVVQHQQIVAKHQAFSSGGTENAGRSTGKGAASGSDQLETVKKIAVAAASQNAAAGPAVQPEKDATASNPPAQQQFSASANSAQAPSVDESKVTVAPGTNSNGMIIGLLVAGCVLAVVGFAIGHRYMRKKEGNVLSHLSFIQASSLRDSTDVHLHNTHSKAESDAMPPVDSSLPRLARGTMDAPQAVRQDFYEPRPEVRQEMHQDSFINETGPAYMPATANQYQIRNSFGNFAGVANATMQDENFLAQAVAAAASKAASEESSVRSARYNSMADSILGVESQYGN